MSKKNRSKNKTRKVDLFYTLTYENGVVVKTSGTARGNNGIYKVQNEPAMIKSADAAFHKVVVVGKKEKVCEEVNGKLKVM